MMSKHDMAFRLDSHKGPFRHAPTTTARAGGAAVSAGDCSYVSSQREVIYYPKVPGSIPGQPCFFFIFIFLYPSLLLTYIPHGLLTYLHLFLEAFEREPLEKEKATSQGRWRSGYRRRLQIVRCPVRFWVDPNMCPVAFLISSRATACLPFIQDNILFAPGMLVGLAVVLFEALKLGHVTILIAD